MNYKTTTISLTLSLTISYIGLIILYGVGLAEGLNSQSDSFSENVTQVIDKPNTDFSENLSSIHINKEVWQSRLAQAELMLNLLNEQDNSFQ